MTVETAGICYVLFCFRDTEYVSFLLSAIYRNKDIILVHCDPKSPRELVDFIDDLAFRYSNIRRLPSREYSWAGYSHVKVCIDAIDLSLRSPQPWSHLIFLSEQHLPLRSPDAIEAWLQDRGSVAELTKASQMAGDAQADIKNRFSSLYIELPGVGAFATQVSNRDDEHLQYVYHGSNWIVLSRAHCDLMLHAEHQGWLDQFACVVHAEEMAIQSIIGPEIRHEDNTDTTVVAWPHLTDNPDMVFNDDLFRSAIGGNALFIRKRPKKLSSFVREFVMSNHFQVDISRSVENKNKDLDQRRPDLATSKYEALKAHFYSWGQHGVKISRIGQGLPGESPLLHVVLNTDLMKPEVSVRILSENLIDFKLCIIKSAAFSGVFSPPVLLDGNLHTTARVRVFGVFGQDDIIPQDIDSAGFVHVALGMSLRPLLAMTERYLFTAQSVS